jgi:UDP-galactopyranose mutase
VNYTEKEVPYTRIIEHKHFEFGRQPKTVVTKEYPEEWTQEKEPYYPINDVRNTGVFKKYQQLAAEETNVIFGGRLAEYRYYDMHQIVASALKKASDHLD